MNAKQAKRQATANKKKIDEENLRLAPQRAKEAAERARLEREEREGAIKLAVDRIKEIVGPAITSAIARGEMTVSTKITTSELYTTQTGMSNFQLLDYYRSLLTADGYKVEWEQTLEEDHEGPGIFRFKVSWT